MVGGALLLERLVQLAEFFRTCGGGVGCSVLEDRGRRQGGAIGPAPGQGVCIGLELPAHLGECVAQLFGLRQAQYVTVNRQDALRGHLRQPIGISGHGWAI